LSSTVPARTHARRPPLHHERRGGAPRGWAWEWNVLSAADPVWLEIGGAASVEWRIIGRLSVLGGVGFSLPASRPTFFFENATMASETTTVYQPPTHAGEARLGLAIRFL